MNKQGANLLLKMLKAALNEADVERKKITIITGDVGGKDLDDEDPDVRNHKQSFLVGEEIVQKVVPQVYDSLPDEACRCCFSKGAMLAAISYATFLHHFRDDTEPDEELRKSFHDLLDDAFDNGFKAHAEWLAGEDAKEAKSATKH